MPKVQSTNHSLVVILIYAKLAIASLSGKAPKQQHVF